MILYKSLLLIIVIKFKAKLRVNSKSLNRLVKMCLERKECRFEKADLPTWKSLEKAGVLHEIKSESVFLELDFGSHLLNDGILDLAEKALGRKLPVGISAAFQFLEEFDSYLVKEYRDEKGSSFFRNLSEEIKSYVLYLLSTKYDTDVKVFVLSLPAYDLREIHLRYFEESFFKFLTISEYSYDDLYEVLVVFAGREDTRPLVLRYLRGLWSKSIIFALGLFNFLKEKEIPDFLLASILIGVYNSGNSIGLSKAIELKGDKPLECFLALSRFNYVNVEDAEKAFGLLEPLVFDYSDLAKEQIYFIVQMLDDKRYSSHFQEAGFKMLFAFMQLKDAEIAKVVLKEVQYRLAEFEKEKFILLNMYLNVTEDFQSISKFFGTFQNPSYVFITLVEAFNSMPSVRFDMKLFREGILHGWSVARARVEGLILELFTQNNKGGLLATKVIGLRRSPLFVDLLKLEEEEHQINAVNSIFKFSSSLIEMLPLLLPLRNSPFKSVKKLLQNRLVEKVYFSFQGLLHDKIKSSISKGKKDKEFLRPITNALADFKKMRKLKETIKDIDPVENERELMNEYYRMEREQKTTIIRNAEKGSHFLSQLAKRVSVVRGNSFKIRDKEPSVMQDVGYDLILDPIMFRNPDLYQFELESEG